MTTMKTRMVTTHLKCRCLSLRGTRWREQLMSWTPEAEHSEIRTRGLMQRTTSSTSRRPYSLPWRRWWRLRSNFATNWLRLETKSQHQTAQQCSSVSSRKNPLRTASPSAERTSTCLSRSWRRSWWGSSLNHNPIKKRRRSKSTMGTARAATRSRQARRRGTSLVAFLWKTHSAQMTRCE